VASSQIGAFSSAFKPADAGMRKPDLSFFKDVDEIKAEASSVTFVNDNIENVLAARSLGIRGIIFDDAKRIRQVSRYVDGDPMIRGLALLEERDEILQYMAPDGIAMVSTYRPLP
jgi:FMN phosphatase YigB (HAD superfamily)